MFATITPSTGPRNSESAGTRTSMKPKPLHAIYHGCAEHNRDDSYGLDSWHRGKVAANQVKSIGRAEHATRARGVADVGSRSRLSAWKFRTNSWCEASWLGCSRRIAG